MSHSQPRVHLLAHSSKGWVSRAIRWQTRSAISHISGVIDDVFVEAREGVGVRALAEIPWDGKSTIIPFRLEPELTHTEVDQLKWFLLRQVGKGYDYRMIARFITRRNRESRGDQEKWFCSELWFAGLRYAGSCLLARTAPWEVSPGVFVKSPLLVEEPLDHPLRRAPAGAPAVSLFYGDCQRAA